MSPVVLVTGCSSGIGRTTAKTLAHAGYAVVATARNLDDLADLDAGLKLPLDVTRQASVDAALVALMERYGRIDALINNAGYAVLGAIEEVPDDAVRHLYDVNVFGVLRMIRAVAPVMRAQRSGRIVLLSSVAGKLPTPANGVYASSKAAIEALGGCAAPGTRPARGAGLDHRAGPRRHRLQRHRRQALPITDRRLRVALPAPVPARAAVLRHHA
ncbi:MAG: SDR family NAD(P)-dependent oxidoreductase [Micropruina sp.]|nr:SDR family NAD(P)-dependent oxidoreductase [Micropruina sp.]